MGTNYSLDTYMRILEVQHKYVHLRYIHVLTRRIIIIIKYIQSCIFFFRLYCQRIFLFVILKAIVFLFYRILYI